MRSVGGPALAVLVQALLALAAAEPSCGAQAPAFWPEAVDTIRVTAPRPFPEERIAHPRGFVQVVPLGRDAPAGADLGDLLEEGAGVSVRRLGGSGSMTLASIRGSSPSQVQVEIDGTPLATSPDGIADLSLLPARLFDAVEIERGPLSSAEGAAAAGVIRLLTPDRLVEPPRVRVTAGSFGTSGVSGAAGAGRGPVSVLFAGGREASDGDYPYLDRNGTPFDPSDDRVVRRRNNAFHQEDFLLRARWKAAPDVALDYTGHGFWKDGGVPGTEVLQTEHVRDAFHRLLNSVALRAGKDGGPSADLSLHQQDDADHYANLDGEVGLGRADTRSRLRARGLDGSVAVPILPAAASARVAFAAGSERWRPEDLLSGGAGATSERTTGSLTAETVLRGAGIEVSALDRVLRAEDRFGGGPPARRTISTPRLGATVDLADGLRARASWGRFTRLPSFVELFGQGGVEEGNAALTPERGAMWDVGGTWLWERDPGLRASLELAGFETRTRDAIVWLQNSQRTTRPQNLESTRVRGMELVARGAWRPRRGPSVGLTATATVQDARDDGPSATYHGKELPLIPARQASIETRIEKAGWRLVHRVDLESAMYRDRYNSAEMLRPARTLQDLEATRMIRAGLLQATLAVENLTDRRTQDVEGFPLPGRSFLIELTWTAP